MKTSYASQTLSAVILIAATLATLLAAGQAQAVGLAAAGPVNSTAVGAPPPANGLPSWYMDSNGLALQGCLDNTPLGTIAPMCVLPIIQEEDYDFHFPIVYNGGLTGDLVAFPNGPPPGPTSGINTPGTCAAIPLGGVLQPGCVNYPSETFYYYVSSNPKVPLTIGTGSVSLVLMALEGAYVTKDGRQLQQSPPLPATSKAIGNSRPVNGTQGVFQRFKILMTAPVAGNYTFTHPWGSIVFNCPTAGGLCKLIQDIPLGTPLNFLSAPDPALGQQTLGSIGPFMVSANPLPPATPAPLVTNAPTGNQFIGNPTATGTKGVIPGGLTACPTCNIDANGFSFMRIDGPPGSLLTTGNITEFFIGGQVLGMSIAPPAAGTDFGLWKGGAPSTGKTFTVTNHTGIPATISGIASDNPAYTIPAATDHCTTGPVTVPPTVGATPPLPSTPGANTCTFDVVFTPTANGLVTGNLTITAVALPSVKTTVTGTGDTFPPALTLSPASKFINSTAVTLSGTAADNNGISGVSVSINGGAAQAATFTAGTWTLTNPTGLVANGATPNTIAVTASDIAQAAPGNQTTINDTITVDTLPPSVVVDPLASATTTVATQTVTGTASDANGITSLGVNLNGTLQGLATVVASTWSYTVTGLVPNAPSSITATATDPAGNKTTSAPVSITFAVPHDGDINMDGKVDIADALMALRTSVSLVTPTAEQGAHGDVSPLDATGKPLGDNKLDVADALLILRKVVGLVTSF